MRYPLSKITKKQKIHPYINLYNKMTNHIEILNNLGNQTLSRILPIHEISDKK